MSDCRIHSRWVLVLGVLLTGCGANTDASSSGEPAPARNMPMIHLEQSAETWLDGANVARASYRQALSACQAAGLPTQALSPDDEALLGTTRYEAWLSAEEEVFRTREWSLAAEGASPSCMFRLDVSGMQETQRAAEIVNVDLATGERSQSPAAPDALVRYAAEDEEGDPLHGYTGPGKRTVAGQPCNVWTEAAGKLEQCVWSAGGPWGFTPGALNDYRPSRDALVLEQKPLDGNGIRLTTQRMTVGKPFERGALEAPRAPAIER